MTTPWHTMYKNYKAKNYVAVANQALAAVDNKDLNFGAAWVFGLELEGTFPILKFFGIGEPLKGDWGLSGGISYTTENICPQIPFSVTGYAGMSMNLGLKTGMPGIGDIDALKMTLKLNAAIVKVEEGIRRTRTDRRRGWEVFWDYTRRRRATYKSMFLPYSCQYVFTAHAQLFFIMNAIELWFKLVYKMVQKELTLTLGANFHPCCKLPKHIIMEEQPLKKILG